MPILDVTDNDDLIEDPEKEIIEKEYDECVEVAVANGASREALYQEYLLKTAEPGSI